MKAQFIVIEGLEGAGKSTITQYVQASLKKAGVKHLISTREPGGTPFAEKIRAIIKCTETKEPLNPYAELLLIYASRVQLVEQVIKPALITDNWIIADRYELSTQAYQGGGRQLPDQMITELYHWVLGDFSADFTLYLDIDPALGLTRIKQRGSLDRIEQEDLAFFTRVREKYLALAQADDNIVLIDASQPLVKVCQSVCTALQQQYPELSIHYEE